MTAVAGRDRRGRRNLAAAGRDCRGRRLRAGDQNSPILSDAARVPRARQVSRAMFSPMERAEPSMRLTLTIPVR